VTSILPHPFGIVTMLAIILGTITANVINIYSGSISLLTIDIGLVRAIAPKRWIAALLVGVIGGLLSLIGGQSGYYNNYSNFLFVLAYWISPWLAVVVCDFLIIRRKRQDLDDFYTHARPVRAGLWAFLIGFACSIPFFNQTMYVGYFAKHWPQIGDLSYYVSFIVAFILYAAFAKREHVYSDAHRAS
jgi:NCS1 family nucleobase:cation symporter-1